MEEKNKILSTINSPLVFFALALLIVESSLVVVLVWSNLDISQKFYGMWALIGLFIMLMIIVFSLVWFKPKNLIFEAEDHLKDKFGQVPVSSPKKSFLETKQIQKQANAKIKIISQNKPALIEYKVDSVLPGTVSFNLLKDGKVWFWISNLEYQKYLAFVKITLKTESHKIELDDKYYGGKEPWKLNALTGIHAPGMSIPEEIKEDVRNGEALDIVINCEIKDEEGNFIEKKLPVIYRYSSQTNTWYLEP